MNVCEDLVAMMDMMEKEEDLPRRRVLVAKYRIGSSQAKMNYTNEEKAFHKTDVPPEVRKEKWEKLVLVSYLKLCIALILIQMFLWKSSCSRNGD